MLPFRLQADSGAKGVLAAFCPTRSDSRLADVLSRVESGTNRWILEDEQVTAWLSGRADPNRAAPGHECTIKTIKKLWFYGKPGSGRTTVAACVTQKLLEQATPQHAVGYFVCDDHEDDRNPIYVLQTLIAQTAQQGEAAYGEYQRSVVQKLMPPGLVGTDAAAAFDSDDMSHLGSLLLAMSRHFERVSLVFSRIDYMPPDFIFDLSSLVDAPDSRMRTLLTTMDGHGQQSVCNETMSCPLSIVVTTEDVRLHVRNEIERRIAKGDAFLQPPPAQQVIEDYIANNNNGSWLWAVHMLEEQCDLLRRGLWQPPSAATETNGDDQQSDLVKYVLDPYLERVLRETNPLPKFMLKTVTRWLCATCDHPILQMTTLEMCACISVFYQKQNESAHITNVGEQDVLTACGPLIRKVPLGDYSVFAISHSSMHDYMTHNLANYGPPLSELWYGDYSLSESTGQLREACGLLGKEQSPLRERLYLAILEVEEKAWGPDNEKSLRTVESLGNFYWDQGRMEEAEEMYGRAVRGYGRHPPTESQSECMLDAYSALAILRKRKGRFEEAEGLFKVALEGRERVLGKKHECTIGTMNNMGIMYAAQDRTAKAQEVWSQCLPLYEEVFGPDHEDTIILVYNLGLAHKSMRQFDHAERLLRRARRAYAETLGSGDTATLDAANALGHLYILMDQMQDAEVIYLNLLAVYFEKCGRDSEKTLEARHSLGKIYQSQERLGEAEEMLMLALVSYEAMHGWDHVNTVDVGYTLFLQMEPPQGVKLGERVLASFEKLHGPYARVTNSTADRLGLMYAELGQLGKAEPMWMRAFIGHLETRGANDSTTMAAAQNLGMLFRLQKRPAEAEEWLLRAQAGFEDLGGANDETTRQIARELLAQVVMSWTTWLAEG